MIKNRICSVKCHTPEIYYDYNNYYQHLFYVGYKGANDFVQYTVLCFVNFVTIVVNLFKGHWISVDKEFLYTLPQPSIFN